MQEKDLAKLARIWNKKGDVHEDAPQWAKLRADMRSAFPSPYNLGGYDPLADLVGHAIQLLDQLKPEPPGRAFLGTDPSDPSPDYHNATKAVLAEKMQEVKEVVNQSVQLFEGLPNWNHPLTMPNVIPPANIAAIIAAMMTDVFSPNIIEGEYSWRVELSELESTAIVAKLIGWDAKQAGGLYTFGGSGCYFYGLKYALTRVLGVESRHKGIRTDGKLLVSQQGHYCKLNSTDWTGLGMNNIIEIETDEQTNAMNVAHLEQVMRELHEWKIPVIAVVCTMGTTDAFAIDPVAKARELIEKYPNPDGYGKTFLYCDAVIGWSWLTFAKYNFDANPLGFSAAILPEIKKNYLAIKDVVHADAIGCDFHKVGWAPYNCSLFMIKNNEEFTELMSRPGSAYLQSRTDYNPGDYTLEVSRSGSYSMAGWATLKFLGYEGFQSILGGILEIQHYLRQRLQAELTTVCVNLDDYGFVTLFRVYPQGVNAKAQYHKELTDKEAKNELIKHNELQKQVADLLWKRFRNGNEAPYISYSSGFRPTEYNLDESDSEAMVFALKAFPMNVNINRHSMDFLLKSVLQARNDLV